MSATYNKKIEELEEDVGSIREDVIGMKHVMQSQEKILSEVKDVLKSQNETLSKVIALSAELRSQRAEIDDLKETFETRKAVTDENNRNFSEFVSKIKFGTIVALFFIGIIQSMVAWQYSGLVDDFKDHVKDQNVTIDMIKEKLNSMNQAIHRNHSGSN